LPKTELNLNYAGREAGAAWRTEADARIESIRKGDLTVQVRDEAGNAVPGAEVSVAMKKHAFGFGSAVTADLITGTNATYKQKFLKNFNKAVLENDLKWPAWIGD
jgi:hypothetical protein